MLLNRDTAEGIANGSHHARVAAMGRAEGETGRHAADRRGHAFASTTSPNTRAATAVTAAQARAAGYPDAKTAQKELDRRPAKHTYVIAVSYLAPDERPELAADDGLSTTDVDAITARLGPLGRGHRTPWTRRYLEMIGANEAVRAPDLAARVGLDVPRFKRRVRQLKGLGLTISLDVGYRLSPRQGISTRVALVIGAATADA